jgi:hypothetical protein
MYVTPELVCTIRHKDYLKTRQLTKVQYEYEITLFILQPNHRIHYSFCNLITGSGINFATSPDPVFILLPNQWIQYLFGNLITDSASSLNFILCPFHDFFNVNFATRKELFENTNKTFIITWIRINFCSISEFALYFLFSYQQN